MPESVGTFQINLKDLEKNAPSTDQLVGYYQGEFLFVQSSFLASHLKFILGFASSDSEVANIVKHIASQSALQGHLEKLFSLSARSISSFKELEQVVQEFSHPHLSGPQAPWSPSQLEDLLQVYSQYGPEEMQRLLYILGDPQSGGLGYKLRLGGHSLSRWDFDPCRRDITLPSWITGVFHTLTDDLGGKTQRVTNHLAAELLKTLIHEKFLDQESERSGLYRTLEGGALVLGAAAASIEASPLLILFVFLPQAIEGATKIAGTHHRQGINPMREAFGKVGELVGGEDGEAIAKGSYELASLVLCFKGGTKIMQVPRSEEEFLLALRAANEEFKLPESTATALKEMGTYEVPNQSALLSASKDFQKVERLSNGTLGDVRKYDSFFARKIQVEYGRELYKLIDQLDFSTGYGEAVFYSGIKTEIAADFATNRGLKTIEMTPGGKYLNDLNLFSSSSGIPLRDALKIWRKASARFARQAKGRATLLEKARDYSKMRRSAYRNVEQRVLRSNQKVTGVDKVFLKGNQ